MRMFSQMVHIYLEPLTYVFIYTYIYYFFVRIGEKREAIVVDIALVAGEVHWKNNLNRIVVTVLQGIPTNKDSLPTAITPSRPLERVPGYARIGCISVRASPSTSVRYIALLHYRLPNT